jgi:hypothetical protein
LKIPARTVDSWPSRTPGSAALHPGLLKVNPFRVWFSDIRCSGQDIHPSLRHFSHSVIFLSSLRPLVSPFLCFPVSFLPSSRFSVSISFAYQKDDHLGSPLLSVTPSFQSLRHFSPTVIFPSFLFHFSSPEHLSLKGGNATNINLIFYKRS